jgi:hypothetical protein
MDDRPKAQCQGSTSPYQDGIKIEARQAGVTPPRGVEGMHHARVFTPFLRRHPDTRALNTKAQPLRRMH